MRIAATAMIRTVASIDKSDQVEQSEHRNKSHVNFSQYPCSLCVIRLDILRFKLARVGRMGYILGNILGLFLLDRELLWVHCGRHDDMLHPRLCLAFGYAIQEGEKGGRTRCQAVSQRALCWGTADAIKSFGAIQSPNALA